MLCNHLPRTAVELLLQQLGHSGIATTCIAKECSCRHELQITQITSPFVTLGIITISVACWHQRHNDRNSLRRQGKTRIRQLDSNNSAASSVQICAASSKLDMWAPQRKTRQVKPEGRLGFVCQSLDPRPQSLVPVGCSISPG